MSEGESADGELQLPARAPAGGEIGNEAGRAASPAEELLVNTKEEDVAEISAAGAPPTAEEEATARLPLPARVSTGGAKGKEVGRAASPAEGPLVETRGERATIGWTTGARPKAEREVTDGELPSPARAPAGGVKGNKDGRTGGLAVAEVLAAEALPTEGKEATAGDGAKAPGVWGVGAARLAGAENSSGRTGTEVTPGLKRTLPGGGRASPAKTGAAGAKGKELGAERTVPRAPEVRGTAGAANGVASDKSRGKGTGESNMVVAAERPVAAPWGTAGQTGVAGASSWEGGSAAPEVAPSIDREEFASCKSNEFILL
jgi:hypothetical protein